MGSTNELALQVVGPAMKRADDGFGLAPAFKHDGLPMSADIRQEFDAAIVMNENSTVVFGRQRMESARFVHHQSMTDITRPRFKTTLELETKHGLAEIAVHRKLCWAWCKPRKGSDIRHQTPSLKKKAL